MIMIMHIFEIDRKFGVSGLNFLLEKFVDGG